MNILETLNIRDIVLKENSFEGKMEVTDFHSQGFGILHGGLTITLAETLAGYGSNNIISDDLIAVGQNVTANHISPKIIGGYVRAYGKLIHKGNKIHIWHIDVLDEYETLISTISITNFIVSKKGIELNN